MSVSGIYSARGMSLWHMRERINSVLRRIIITLRQERLPPLKATVAPAFVGVEVVADVYWSDPGKKIRSYLSTVWHMYHVRTLMCTLFIVRVASNLALLGLAVGVTVRQTVLGPRESCPSGGIQTACPCICTPCSGPDKAFPCRLPALGLAR